MSDHAAPASSEKPSLLSNVLAIIGLIILVVIIVWGLVHLAELSSGWFSSLFGKSTPTIQVTAPSDAVSGTAATVSWNYSTSASGSYAFLYQCQTGLQFALINTTTNTAVGIQCGTATPVTPTSSNNSSSIAVLPILTGTTSASVPISIIFTPTSGAQVQGSATMTIHPSSNQTGTATGTQTGQTSTTAPAKATTSKPVYTNAYSPSLPADLYVHIVSEYVDQYGNGTVTFNVQNIGGTTSGTYYFSAVMPTSTMTPYTSVLQAPLTPGSYISDTLHFSPAVSGNFQVSLGAHDANQSNNYASTWINAPVGYNNYNSYNYNYNSYNNSNPYNVQYQTQTYSY